MVAKSRADDLRAGTPELIGPDRRGTTRVATKIDNCQKQCDLLHEKFEQEPSALEAVRASLGPGGDPSPFPEPKGNAARVQPTAQIGSPDVHFRNAR